MKQAVDHVSGGDFRRPPPVALTRQQPRQVEDLIDIFFELVQFAVGIQQPGGEHDRAQLAPPSLLPLVTAAFVLAAATATATSIARPRWRLGLGVASARPQAHVSSSRRRIAGASSLLRPLRAGLLSPQD